MLRCRFYVAVMLLALIGSNLTFLSTKAQSNAPESKGTVVVGSTKAPDQVLLGQILIGLLKEAGYTITDKTALGDAVTVHAALTGGQVDLAWEESSTALTLYHKLSAKALPIKAEQNYALAQSLEAEQGLVWLKPSKINNRQALLVRQDLADKGVKSLTDLAGYLKTNPVLKLCATASLATADARKELETLYRFMLKQENVVALDQAKIPPALQNGQCDIAIESATTGWIPTGPFSVLDDPLTYFPLNIPAPVIRQAFADQHPELAELVGRLSEQLDTVAMQQLNARITLGADGKVASGDEETPQDVAYGFLRSKRLVKAPKITVGSTNATEQLLLGKMVVLMLQSAGYEVADLTGRGGAQTLRRALESGDADIDLEYISTGLTTANHLPPQALPTDSEKAYNLVKSLDGAKGLVWLNPSRFSNANSLLVTQALVDKGVNSIDDLAKFMNANQVALKICVETEFFSDAITGLPALQTAYGFQFKTANVLLMSADKVYSELRANKCDVASGRLLDERIKSWNLTALVDSRGFFPVSQLAPVVRQKALTMNPEIDDLLNKLFPLLDTATMQQLNARITLGADGKVASGDEEAPQDVAYRFLRSKRLVKAPKITVASTNDTEQLLLGKMAVLILQNAGYEVADVTGRGSAQTLRHALESGETDLDIEYVNTALTVANQLPIQALPTDPEKAYNLVKSLDGAKGLVWLNPSRFSNTHTLVGTQTLVSKGIKSIEALAKYMNANESSLKICVDTDFFGDKVAGLAPLQATYGFQFKTPNVLLTSSDKLYSDLLANKCDVASSHGLDGRIKAWDLTLLLDSRGFFPNSTLGLVVRQKVLAANPEISDLLNNLFPLLDTATMQQLNARITLGADGKADSGDEEATEVVARDFLTTKGLLTAPKVSVKAIRGL